MTEFTFGKMVHPRGALDAEMVIAAIFITEEMMMAYM